MRPLLLCLLALLLGVSVPVAAQGGPPFLTDDPETPGANHWEINFGFIADRNPGAGAYQLPDFDLNYGLGDRIQLKYELPIALSEQRTALSTPGTPSATAGTSPSTPQGFNAGLGESLLGIKWRFYQHHPADPLAAPFNFGAALGLPARTRTEASAPETEGSGGAPGPAAKDPASDVINLSVSTYPQLSLNNPTTSVARGVVPPGPDFFLPLETNGRIGPIRLDTEVGYHFGNRNLAQRWIRGLLIGHEFSERTELYLELYDAQDANRVPGPDGLLQPKQRESTLGAGGRQALTPQRHLLLLFMAGRSFQTSSAANSQPSFIAYMGLQLLLGKDEDNPQVEQKLPDEDRPRPPAPR